MRARSRSILRAALGLLLAHRQAAAEPDRHDLSIRSETHVELFRRALVPGPNGALVETDTAVPAYQHLRLHARDLDASWQKDSIDVELSVWGRAWLGDSDASERRFDGDVQSASARVRLGPAALRFGRQHAAGGAARYVRFDGLALAATLGSGIDAEAYGGLTVLPRWDARPGYHHLGAAADSLLRDPEAVPEPERSGHWLGGGRIGWASDRVRASTSFHEQHEPTGLSRRSFGFDGSAVVSERTSFGLSSLFELDAQRIQDARLYVDVAPVRPLDLTLDVSHMEPALFLSRQSVLSVFGTDAYEEVGGTATLRAGERVSLEGRSSLQVYDYGRPGARGELAVRLVPGVTRRTRVRIAYGRVLAADNGYHSLRASLSRRFAPVLSGTLEAHAYLYDEPIRGRTSSEVYSGTLGVQPADTLDVTWGASLAQSPYASFDAQTLVRISYELDGSTLGATR